MSWHANRFSEDSRKEKVFCRVCARAMYLPKSKCEKYLTCSAECTKKLRGIKTADRQRTCETCGGKFLPRRTQLAKGHGRFCSQKCNTVSHQAMNSEPAQAKSKESFRIALELGKVRILRGEENPRWKGGRAAAVARGMKKKVASTRAYRQANPDKVREFSQRRRTRKLGRLPRGTVAEIGQKQQWKCAICRIRIAGSFHVDHIMPLALGGLHEPQNIQLLCPGCNLQKSDKHPVKHMQERGLLL